MKKFTLRQLSQVDWDFVHSDGRKAAGLHWYPGTFVPGLPGAFIDALAHENSVIFDPYGGIGTTGMASLLRGKHPIICDVNPIAVMSSFCSMSLLCMQLHKPEFLDIVFGRLISIADGSETPSSLFSSAGLNDFKEVDKFIKSVSGIHISSLSAELQMGTPNIEKLEKWYHPATLKSALRAYSKINETENGQFVGLLGNLMFSAIAKPLCSQTRSWGHLADNCLPKEFMNKNVSSAARFWITKVRRRIGSLKPAANYTRSKPGFTVLRVDWRYQTPKFKALEPHIMITSPPYAGAIDYTWAQRLSLYWMGYSDEKINGLSTQEIGARRRRSQQSHVADWAKQISDAAVIHTEYLSGDGLAVFILPHKEAGRQVGVDMLKQSLSETGWIVVFEKDRAIRQTRTRQSWTSIKRETILVFERVH